MDIHAVGLDAAEALRQRFAGYNKPDLDLKRPVAVQEFPAARTEIEAWLDRLTDELKKARPRARDAVVCGGSRRVAEKLRQFKKYLPRVQAYYAVKANPCGDCAHAVQGGGELRCGVDAGVWIVYENIKDMPAKERQEWIWDKIIYANPIKANETLAGVDQYKPLVTYDNARGNPENQEARAPRGAGVAAEGAEYRGDGGAVFQIRRCAGRSGGSDPRGAEGRADRRRA